LVKVSIRKFIWLFKEMGVKIFIYVLAILCLAGCSTIGHKTSKESGTPVAIIKVYDNTNTLIEKPRG